MRRNTTTIPQCRPGSTPESTVYPDHADATWPVRFHELQNDPENRHTVAKNRESRRRRAIRPTTNDPNELTSASSSSSAPGSPCAAVHPAAEAAACLHRPEPRCCMIVRKHHIVAGQGGCSGRGALSSIALPLGGVLGDRQDRLSPVVQRITSAPSRRRCLLTITSPRAFFQSRRDHFSSATIPLFTAPPEGRFCDRLEHPR